MADKVPYTVAVTQSGSTYVFPGTPDRLQQSGQHQGRRFPERPRLYTDEYLKTGGPIVTRGPVRKGEQFEFSYTDRKGGGFTSLVVSVELEYRDGKEQ